MRLPSALDAWTNSFMSLLLCSSFFEVTFDFLQIFIGGFRDDRPTYLFVEFQSRRNFDANSTGESIDEFGAE
jgi:hypothetical protein